MLLALHPDVYPIRHDAHALVPFSCAGFQCPFPGLPRGWLLITGPDYLGVQHQRLARGDLLLVGVLVVIVVALVVLGQF